MRAIGAAFLTGVHAKPTEGADFQAGISIDQIAAASLGQETQLARSSSRSSRPSSPAPATPATAAPTPTPSAGAVRRRRCRWRTIRARCSSGCSATAQHRSEGAARRAPGRTAACSIRSPTRSPSLQRDVGTGRPGQARPSISMRCATSSGGSRRPRRRARGSCRRRCATGSIPGSFEEHARLMFDLQVLAYQTDLTRVITFMIGNELSGRTYPEIGVPDPHHPLSHHQNDPAQAREAEPDQHPSPRAVRLLPREAAHDPGWRRHAARSDAADLRQRHERQQPARPENLPILLVGGGAGAMLAAGTSSSRPARR